MKKFLLFFVILFGNKVWAQDCKTLYVEICKYDFVFKPGLDTAALNNYLDSQYTNLIVLDRLILSGCANSAKKEKFKTAMEQWISFSETVKEFIANTEDEEPINSDIDRLRTSYNNLKHIMSDYTDLIFPDYSLLNKIMNTTKNIDANVDRMYNADSSNNFNGVKFLKRSDSVAMSASEKVDSVKKDYIKFRDTTASSFKAAAETAEVISNTSHSIKKVISDTLVKDIDSLKYFLFKRDTTIRRLVIHAGAFQDGLYDVGLVYVLSKKPGTKTPVLFGVTVFFPIDSRRYQNIGGAGFAGFQHRSWLIKMGIIFINNDLQSQNISWCTGFLYHPYKCPILIGLNYSPLTRVGISLGLKL